MLQESLRADSIVYFELLEGLFPASGSSLFESLVFLLKDELEHHVEPDTSDRSQKKGRKNRWDLSFFRGVIQNSSVAPTEIDSIGTCFEHG